VRTLLKRIDQRLHCSGKVVVIDTLHTHQDTARLIVQKLGADYLFALKANQETLRKTMHGLLAARAIFPSGSDKDAQRLENKRSREEHRQPRLQDTTREQVCFVAAPQRFAELKISTMHKAKRPGRLEA
jgi:DNA-binding NarL/FixJ family response regulator